MQFRVSAYKCKVGSTIELSDEVTPIGSFYEPPDLYVICLEPLEERKLPEEETEEVSEQSETKED